MIRTRIKKRVGAVVVALVLLSFGFTAAKAAEGRPSRLTDRDIDGMKLYAQEMCDRWTRLDEQEAAAWQKFDADQRAERTSHRREQKEGFLTFAEGLKGKKMQDRADALAGFRRRQKEEGRQFRENQRLKRRAFELELMKTRNEVRNKLANDYLDLRDKLDDEDE